MKEQFDMTNQELKDFFNKYNLLDLETFINMFKYVEDYDMTNVVESINEVYGIKLRDCDEIYECAQRHMSYKITDIIEKNEQLNMKELVFLKTISDDALMCLDSIEHIDVEEEKISVDKIVEETTSRIDKINNNVKVKAMRK